MQVEKIESAPGYMAGYSSATDYYMSQACKQAAAQGETEELFRQACKVGDVNASTAAWPGAPAHYPTLADAMNCALDFTKGPAHADAYQLLLDAANGKNTQAAAQKLIDRMASRWADFFSPEVE